MMAIQEEKERNVQTFYSADWKRIYFKGMRGVFARRENGALLETTIKGKYVGRLIDQMINEMMDLETNPKYHTSVSE